MDEMVKLAERCEKATADEQGALLREAFEAIHGPKPVRIHGGSPELAEWFKLFGPFYRLTTEGGFLDAAMTLVPEGCAPWHCGKHNKTGKHPRTGRPVDGGGDAYLTLGTNEPIYAMAVTPALALCAAALRAQATSRGGEG